MTDYIKVDSTNHVGAWTSIEQFAQGFEAVELPSRFFDCPMGDWLYQGGEFTNDGAETARLKQAEAEAAAKVSTLEEVQSQLDAIAGISG